MATKKIGFIGLGAMGLPMAQNVLKNGFELHVTKHKNPKPVETLQSAGAHVHTSTDEVVANSDIVISILPEDKQMEIVLLDEKVLNSFKPGSILIEMTSGSPDMMKKLNETYQKKEIQVLDAPVSGGTVGAENGTLTVMVGGKQAILEKVRHVMDTLSKNVYLVGNIGAGKAIKAINQMLAGIHMIASAEAVSLAKELDVDPEMLKEVIGNSSGMSWMLMNKMDAIVGEDFTPGFKLNLMEKDVRMAVNEGQKTSLPLGSLALQLYKIGAKEHGEADFSSISKYIKA